MARKAEATKPAPASSRGRKKEILLRLYIAGQTPRSVRAISNLRRVCDEHLQGQYKVEVIDLLERPQLAAGDQIVAIPTLVRRLPEPVRKIIGDLSNTESVLVGLNLQPAPQMPAAASPAPSPAPSKKLPMRRKGP